MKAREMLVDGIRRVNGAKRYIVVVYFVNLALALTLAISLGLTIKESLGSSMAAENLRDGFDDLWYRNFSVQARGLTTTFNPGVTGIGAIFNGLDAFLQGKLLAGYPGIVAAGLVYLLLWSFFAAGFIAVYASRDDQSHWPSFFQQGAYYFFRFVGLAIMAGIIYYLIFRFVLPWFGDRVKDITRQTVDERVVFGYTLIKYLVVWGLVFAVNMIFDYSKIITVLHDYKFVLTVPLKAVRVIAGRLASTVGLYLSIGLVWIILLLLYWLIAPGAGQASWWAIMGTFLLGQLYIISRIWTRGLFYAGQTVLYQTFGEYAEIQPAAEPEPAAAAGPAMEDEAQRGGDL